MGYRGPFTVTAKKTPSQIAGNRYNHKQTLYYYPAQTLIPGDKIRDFADLPKGVMVFLPIKNS
jgi:N-acetylmuramoyl-L-alanine amidase